MTSSLTVLVCSIPDQLIWSFVYRLSQRFPLMCSKHAPGSLSKTVWMPHWLYGLPSPTGWLSSNTNLKHPLWLHDKQMASPARSRSQYSFRKGCYRREILCLSTGSWWHPGRCSSDFRRVIQTEGSGIVLRLNIWIMQTTIRHNIWNWGKPRSWYYPLALWPLILPFASYTPFHAFFDFIFPINLVLLYKSLRWTWINCLYQYNK